MNETEVKIRLNDLRKAREKLLAVGAECLGKENQVNSFYDTRDHALTRDGLVLRIRKEAGKNILCFKGKKSVVDGIKSREEIECLAGAGVEAILEGLGYELKICYEKERETFTLEGAEVVLDKAPLLGDFLEIEAGKERIEEVLKVLGLEKEERLPQGYIKLYKSFFKGKTPKQIMFKGTEGEADIV